LVVAHNMKFEVRNMRAHTDIELFQGADSMLDAYVLSEWQSVGLKQLTKDIFGHEQIGLVELFELVGMKLPKNKEPMLRFNVLPSNHPEVVSYACEDAAWCLALYYHYHQRALDERTAMQKLEHAIMDLMAEVESYGVAVDWQGLELAHAQAEMFIPELEAEVKRRFSEWAKTDLSAVNLGSSSQMSKLLYETLGLSTTRLTKGGKMSSDSIAMEKLSKEYPTVKKLLELREAKNLANRIEKWLKEYRWAADDRVRANYNQVQVTTGRFAANDPAIQQLPKVWRWIAYGDFNPLDKDNKQLWEDYKDGRINGKEYWDGNFRDFIVAAPGKYLLTFDFSQVELRVLAGVSQEPYLLNAFEKGIDVHTVTAALMLGKRVEDVDPKLDRPKGKTMNFALLYGMGIKSLAERMAVSVDEARKLYDAYFREFSAVSQWMEKAKNDGMLHGYAETPFGRRDTVWELVSSNPAIRNKAERKFVNSPIQGGAADYMKIAMVRARQALADRDWWGSKVMMIMNQHDSLSFEVDNSLSPDEVRNVLIPAVTFEVPGYPKIVADWELGQRWGSSTPWKDEPVEFDGTHWNVVLPDVSTEPIGSVDTMETTVSPETSVKIIVELAKMPTEDRFEQFMELVRDTPGINTLCVRTPWGASIDIDGLTGITVDDQGRISMILGGASVYQTAETVSAGAVMEGLTL
jgi:DNA polymerase-1